MISLFHTFYLLHIVLYGHSPHLSRNVMKSWQMYKTFLEVRLFFAQKITPSDSCTLKCQKYCTAVLFIGFADAFPAPLYTEKAEILHSCCLYPSFRHHRTLKRPNGCTVVTVFRQGDTFSLPLYSESGKRRNSSCHEVAGGCRSEVINSPSH